jgi:hypothetical protein
MNKQIRKAKAKLKKNFFREAMIRELEKEYERQKKLSTRGVEM